MKATKAIKLKISSLPIELSEVLTLGQTATNYAIRRAQETGQTGLGGLKKLIYEEVKVSLGSLHSYYAHSAIKWAIEIYRSFRKRKRGGQIQGEGLPQVGRRAFHFEACLTSLRWQKPILTVTITTVPRRRIAFSVEVSSPYHQELLDAWKTGKLRLGELTIPVSQIFSRHESVVERSTQDKQTPIFKGKVTGKQKGRSRRRAEHSLQIAAWRVVGKALEEKATIVLENLKGVKQRIRWNRRRLHNGWAARKLQRFIREKALWLSIPVVEVDPKHTSKLCPICGQIGLRGEERCARCSCGYEGDRDITAAWNIAYRAATGSSVAPESGASG